MPTTTTNKKNIVAIALSKAQSQQKRRQRHQQQYNNNNLGNNKALLFNVNLIFQLCFINGCRQAGGVSSIHTRTLLLLLFSCILNPNGCVSCRRELVTILK